MSSRYWEPPHCRELHVSWRIQNVHLRRQRSINTTVALSLRVELPSMSLVLSRIPCCASPRLWADTCHNKSLLRSVARYSFCRLPHRPKAQVECVQSLTFSFDLLIQQLCKSFQLSSREINTASWSHQGSLWFDICVVSQRQAQTFGNCFAQDVGKFKFKSSSAFSLIYSSLELYYSLTRILNISPAFTNYVHSIATNYSNRSIVEALQWSARSL